MDRGYWPASPGPGRATPSIRAPSSPPRWVSPATRGAAGQLGEQLGVAAQLVDAAAELGELGLGKVDCAALTGEPSDVVGLVVLGRSGPRDEDRRRARDGDLGHRRRPTSPDEEIGGAIDEVHPALVADDLMDRSRRRGDPAGECVGEALASHVMDGEAAVLIVSLGVRDDGIVERSRALRPASDGEDEAVGRQPERRPRRLRPVARSTLRIAARTGAPVTVARRNGDPWNATADAAAKRAASAVARPGNRSNETTTMGMRSRRAASTAGRLA